jgi:hypothetical protein
MVKLQTEHDLSNGGRRLRTDPRIEANEEISIRAFDLSRPKRSSGPGNLTPSLSQNRT